MSKALTAKLRRQIACAIIKEATIVAIGELPPGSKYARAAQANIKRDVETRLGVKRKVA